MRNGSDSSRHRLFVRLLIPYLVVLIPPLLLGVAVYQYSFRMVRREVEQSNLVHLTKGMALLDERLGGVEMIAQQVLDEPLVRDFKLLPDAFAPDTVYTTVVTQQSIPNYGVYNDFILDYQVIFRNSRTLLTPESTYKLTEYYPYFFQFQGVEYGEWYNRFVDGSFYTHAFLPAMDVVRNQEEHARVIPYVHSTGYPGFNNSKAIVLIDNTRVAALLDGLDFSAGGWAYLVDGSGVILSVLVGDNDQVPTIASLPDGDGVITARINDDKAFVTYTSSQRRGWRLVAIQPSHVVLQRIEFIKRISFSIVAASLLVGALGAYVVAYRKSLRLSAMFDTLSRYLAISNDTRDPYSYIHDAMIYMVDDYQRMETSYSRQLPFIRADFFRRLLEGEFSTIGDVEAARAHTELSIDATAYAVVLFSIACGGPECREEEERERLIGHLRSALRGRGHVLQVKRRNVTVLFMSTESEQESARRELSGFVRVALDWTATHTSLSLTMGVGRTCRSVLDVSRSRDQAQQALNHGAMIALKGVIWYDDLPREFDAYFYPPDVEARLVGMVLSGDTRGLTRALDDVLAENVARRDLSASMIRLLIFEVLGTAIKLLEMTTVSGEVTLSRIDSIIVRDDLLTNTDEVWNEIADIFTSICTDVRKRKKSNNVDLAAQIIDHIEQNASDPNLGLTPVAEQFGISASYLSSFFKEQTGSNFSTYIEYNRIRRAETLLIDSDRPVKEIAADVGYNSVNAFDRAFRRHNGTSPTEYRKLPLHPTRTSNETNPKLASKEDHTEREESTHFREIG